MPIKRVRVLSDTTPLERFEELFFAQWEKLLYLSKRVLKKSNLDDIHDLRIALRRIRLMLKLFKYFTARNAKKTLKKTIRNLTKTLGGLRNIDEALLFFQSRAHFTSKHHLCRKLTKMRVIELQRVKKQLRLFDHQFDKLIRKMMSELKMIAFTKKNHRNLLIYFSKESKSFSKTIRSLIEDSTVIKQNESRHALRIAIRKWRYSLEIISVVLNRDYNLLLKNLKKYQVVLGRLNDIVAFRTLSRDMALPQSERDLAEISLLKEEKLLLKKFTKLLREKPPKFQI